MCITPKNKCCEKCSDSKGGCYKNRTIPNSCQCHQEKSQWCPANPFQPKAPGDISINFTGRHRCSSDGICIDCGYDISKEKPQESMIDFSPDRKESELLVSIGEDEIVVNLKGIKEMIKKNTEKPQECENCDFDNAVRHGRADWRCPKCGRQLMLEMVLMKEAEDKTHPENSWEDGHYRFVEGELNKFKNEKIGYTDFIDDNKHFIKLLLTQEKQKLVAEIMEKLPKEIGKNDHDDEKWAIHYKGFDECLADVKEVIKEFFKG